MCWHNTLQYPLCFISTQKGTAARIPFARFLKSRLPLAGKTQALQQPRGCLLCAYGFRAINALNYKVKLRYKAKSNITHRVQPPSHWYRDCRRRAHSNNLGTSSPSPAAKPGELEESSPLSWTLPASSPCCKLKICWLKSLLEGWFSIFSKRKTFFLAMETDCRHTHTQALTAAQLKGDDFLSCFNSPAPNCCKW